MNAQLQPGKATRSGVDATADVATATPGKGTQVQAHAAAETRSASVAWGGATYSVGSLNLGVNANAYLVDNRLGYHLTRDPNGFKVAGNSGEYWYLNLNNQLNAFTGASPFTTTPHDTSQQLAPQYLGYGSLGGPKIVPVGVPPPQISTSASWRIYVAGYLDIRIDVTAEILTGQNNSPGGIDGLIDDIGNFLGSHFITPLVDDVCKPVIAELGKLEPAISVALDIASFIAPPPWDAVANIANAGLSALGGDYASAVLSAAAGAASLAHLVSIAADVKAGTAAVADAKKLAEAKDGLERIVSVFGSKAPEVKQQTESAVALVQKFKQAHVSLSALEGQVTKALNFANNLNSARQIAQLEIQKIEHPPRPGSVP